MSTKVYNGIKFKSKDFNIILKQLKSLRAPAKEIAINDLKNFQMRVFIGNEDLIDNNPYDVVKKMEISSNKNMRDHEDILINFHVVIYPHPNGNIYGYFFDDIREYKKLLLVDKICEDYHYQNQTDMSNYDEDKESWKSMTKKRQNELENNWEERNDIWEYLIGYGTFSENGFLYEIVDGGRDLWNFRLNKEIVFFQDKYKLQRDRKEKLDEIGT